MWENWIITTEWLGCCTNYTNLAYLRKGENVRSSDEALVMAAHAYLQEQKTLDGMLRQFGKRHPKGRKVLPVTHLRWRAYEEFLDYPRRIQKSQELVASLGERLTELVKDHPVWMEFLKHVKGIGPITAALLIGIIGDIERVTTSSGLWKSFGLAVDDKTGGIQKLKKGEQGITGYPLARTVRGRVRLSIFKVGARLVDLGHPCFYYEYYLRRRARYEREHPDWPKGRQMGAAIVIMHKLLLAHVFEVYRKARGLPAPEPYILTIAPHGQKITPADVIAHDRGEVDLIPSL